MWQEQEANCLYCSHTQKAQNDQEVSLEDKTSRATSSSDVPLPTGSTVIPNSITSWGPSVQIHEPLKDFSYSDLRFPHLTPTGMWLSLHAKLIQACLGHLYHSSRFQWQFLLEFKAVRWGKNMTILVALGRQSQRDFCGFEPGLVYMVSCRFFRTTE